MLRVNGFFAGGIMFRGVILGAPASGKGTISSMIVKHFDIIHLSTGDMLRNEIKNKSNLGMEAKKYIETGKLVPDSLILGLLSSELKKTSGKNWLLDGFPRTRTQAEKLNEIEKISCAVNLVVPFNIIIERVRGRWIHVQSGRVYNEIYKPPKVSGKDDLTGEPLEQREDDKPEAVQRRLQEYCQTVKPVLDFYEQMNVLKEFHGKTSHEIWPKVKTSLSQYLKTRQ